MPIKTQAALRAIEARPGGGGLSVLGLRGLRVGGLMGFLREV